MTFVLEQTLGHVTHSSNLTTLVPQLAADAGIAPTFLKIPFELGARPIPGWSNWTVRAGVRARRALRRSRASAPPDALFVHTQVAATLLWGVMRRTPTVISLDATPWQYDEFGAFYRHDIGPAPAEWLKHRLHRATLGRARRIVVWSAWTGDDLVARYGVRPDLIDVVPPGVDTQLWKPSAAARAKGGPIEVLFVGGDLARKGGDLLIEACTRLRQRDGIPPFELHLVTGAELEPPPGVVVHRGLTPNSPALIERFQRAEIFCLPTLGDCLPMVLAEAAACGLATVSTPVGAIGEIVHPGSTGELVPPGDVDALTEALGRLIGDADLRQAYGANARRLAEHEHDARRNAGRLLATIQAATTT